MAAFRSRQKAASLLDLAEIRAEKAARCKASFGYFLRQCWPVIEPARPLIWGIHTEACVEHLQAVGDGELHRLVANIAPGFGKSSTFSVAFPAWVWTRNPYERFLCASYSLDLAIRDNRNCRMLIESEWYQALFGDVFAMAGDQNVKSYWENDKRGYRLATAVRASGTGKRGSGLLIDDPNNGMAGRAEVEATVEWFGKTWASRLNDQDRGWMIVVGQRLYGNDLTGHLLSLGGWEHLNLPTEFEPGRKCYTSIGWEDPRSEEGELLCAQLLNATAVEKAKSALGALNYAAQHQQSPVPPGGYVFNAANERVYTRSPEGDTYLLETPGGVVAVAVAWCWELTTSDVAAKDKEQNDFTVFAHWAVTPQNDVILLDLMRGHWLIPKQKEKGRLFYRKHYSQRYRALYFEDVGYQSAIGQDLLAEGIPCLEFHPKGDKVFRAGGASIYQEAGKLYFPKVAPWLEDYRVELYQFPKGAHDDQVDPTSMVCMIVRAPQVEALDEDVSSAISNFRGY